MQLFAINVYTRSINNISEETMFQTCLDDIDKLYKRAELVVSEIDTFL